MTTNTQITYQFVAIDNATAILSQIANSLQQIQDLQKNVETLEVGAKQTKQLAQSTQQINTNTQNVNRSLGRTINLMATTRKAINFITDAIKESSSWTENLHMFEVSFGSASDEAYKFAKTIVNAFGTSQNEVIKYAGYFNQIASAIGLAEETTNKFSVALTALGYDIASLYNLTISQAMEKLQAGVVGQTKPLRTLGMDITANSLDAYLKETMKITDVTSKMLNQADKMLLRTVVIMQQAQSVYGDMASTINTFANQIKVLQGSIANLKLAIGDFAKSTLAPLVSGLAGFVIAITSIIRAFVPEEAETGIESIAGAISDVNEELDDTLKKTGLLSFDKFNALSKSDSSSSNISALLEEEFFKRYEEYMATFNSSIANIENNANKVALAIVQWIFPLSEFNEETGEIAVNLEQVNALAVILLGLTTTFLSIGLISNVAKLGDKILGITKSLEGLKGLMSGSTGILGLSGSTLGIVLGIIAAVVLLYTCNENFRKSVNGLLTTIFEIIGQILTALKPALDVIVDVLMMLIDTVGNALVPILDLVVYLLEILAPIVIDIIDFLTPVIEQIGHIILALEPVLVIIGDLIEILVALITMDFSGFGDSLKSLFANIGNFFANIGILVANTFIHLVNMVVALLNFVIDAINVVLKPVDAIAGIFGGNVEIPHIPKWEAQVDYNPIKAFANGGYPENGTLFWANENGPEVVANVGGGQTAVMNIKQYEEACYRGTIRAISDSQPATKSSKVLQINMGSREVARAIVSDIVDEIKRQNLKIE